MRKVKELEEELRATRAENEKNVRAYAYFNTVF